MKRADEAVTPIIGTVLMLGITAIGIAVVLFFGTPLLQRLQGQASLQSMAGQFQDYSDAAADLGAQDAQRILPIRLPAGEIGFADGGRFMVTTDQDSFDTFVTDGNPDFPDCDFHVTGWENTVGGASTLAVSALGCRPLASTGFPIPLPLQLPVIVTCNSGLVACFESYEVTGTALVDIAGASYTPSGQSATAIYPTGLSSTKDYVFRLTDGASTVYASAWLLHTDALHWDGSDSANANSLDFIGGAVLATNQGTIQMPVAPNLSDGTPNAAGDVYLKLITLDADGTAINDRAEHSLSLTAVGTYLRDSTATATRMRYDFDGPSEQPWCRLLDLRAVDDYEQDPLADCEATPPTDTNVVRSIIYDPTGSDSFRVTFLHADLQASIQV